MVAPEGSAPSIGDYKSPVLLLNYRAMNEGAGFAPACVLVDTNPSPLGEFLYGCPSHSLLTVTICPLWWYGFWRRPPYLGLN